MTKIRSITKFYSILFYLFIYLFRPAGGTNVAQSVVEPAAKCKQTLTRRSSGATVDKLIATAAATNPLSSSSV